jgi:uncharacterized membrane protein YsdA (DUF1294 family)
MKPVYFYSIVSFGMAIILCLVLTFGLNWDALLCWLLAITAVTFLTYGYDKSIAGSKRTRVPEAVLLALTLLGGTIGAILGMLVFRHKTAKRSFQVKLGLVIVVQVLLIIAYYVWLKPAYLVS